MATITRHQLRSCVNADELAHKDNAERFNQHFLWLWGAMVTDDVITVDADLKDQLNAMFHGWPKTRERINSLIGA